MDPVENKKQVDSAVRAGSVSAAPATLATPAVSATPQAPAISPNSTSAQPVPTAIQTPATPAPASTSTPTANTAPAHEINSLTPSPVRNSAPQSIVEPQRPAPIQAPTLLFPEQQRQAVNTSTEHGDIILNGGRGGRKKLSKGLIIGIVVAVVLLIVGVVVAAIFAMSGSRRAAVVEKFNAFSTYLNTAPISLMQESGIEIGESDEQEISQNWSLVGLLDSSLSESFKEKYFNNLEQCFTDFLAAQAEANVQSDDLSRLSSLLDQYQSLFLAVTGYASRDLIVNHLVEILVDDGMDGAQTYIDERFPIVEIDESQTQQPIYQVINSYMAAYLGAKLDMLSIYEENGCIQNYAVDYACSTELDASNRDFASASQNANLYGDLLEGLSQVLNDLLKNETENLRVLVEAIYA